MKRLIPFLTGIVAIVFSPPYSAFAGGFAKGEINLEAKALMNRMEISRDISYALKRKLSAALEDPILSKAVNSKDVNAIFVYRGGEGGMVVKFMKGDGLISFKRGRKAAPISLKSWSAGAMIGGSAQWGVGLVMGLADDGDFGGDYRGAVKGATAAESTATGFIVLSHDGDNGGHEIYLISSGRGFSAGLGSEEMTITPGW